MLCQQCGASIDDNATVCENCGFETKSADASVSEPASEAPVSVPAVRTIEEEFAAGEKVVYKNLVVKILSVVGAVLCFTIFAVASNFAGTVNVQTQTQSILGGIFPGGSVGLPFEFLMAMRYGFLGLGAALSTIILILGFKED